MIERSADGKKEVFLKEEQNLFEQYSSGQITLSVFVESALRLLAIRFEKNDKSKANHTSILDQVLERSCTNVFDQIIRNSQTQRFRSQIKRFFDEDSFFCYVPFLNKIVDGEISLAHHVKSLIEDILQALNYSTDRNNDNDQSKNDLKDLVCWLWYKENVRQTVVNMLRVTVLDPTIQPPEKEAKSEEEANNIVRKYWERKLYGAGIDGQEGILFAQHVYYLASTQADSLASKIFGDKSKDIANLIIAVITIRTNNLVPRLREKSGKYVRLSELRQPILKALFDGDLEKAKDHFIALVNKYGKDVVTPYTLKLLGLSDEATNEVN